MTNDVVHWVKIVARHKVGREIFGIMMWRGMLWHTRTRFDWYFRYRAALIQVKHPKAEVVLTWGNEPAVGKSLDDIIRTRIVAKKAAITKIRNRMDAARKSWNSMFPIEEDQHYKEALEAIKKREFELLTLQNQLS